MARAVMVQVMEFKNYRLGGGEMDKLVGSAMRVRFRTRPATLHDIILFCRGYTPEAAARARELEQELNLRITFKVIQ